MATVQEGRRQKLIWLGCVGLAFAGVFFMGLSVLSASRHANKLKGQLRRVRETFNLLLIRRFQLDTFKSHLTLFAHRFGDHTDFPSILHFMTTTARSCGLKIKSLKRSSETKLLPPPPKISSKTKKEERPSATLVRIPVTIEATGRFHQVAVFLGDITNAHFIFQIKKLSIELDEENYPNVVVSVFGDVVFVKERR